MKRILFFVCSLTLAVSLPAQITLQLSAEKTTSLIFPYPVRHVDRGTRDILVEPVREAGHVLLVRAALKNFLPTNLSVITADGSVYSLGLTYGEPSSFVYHIPGKEKLAPSTYADRILDNPKTVIGVRDARGEVEGTLKGIYVKDEAMYYLLYLQNQSPIDYDINFIRFFIRDKKKGKRTAQQEIECEPLNVTGNRTVIKAGSSRHLVVTLPGLAIPRGKYLAIEIAEKGGARVLHLRVSSRQLLKALPLTENP